MKIEISKSISMYKTLYLRHSKFIAKDVVYLAVSFELQVIDVFMIVSACLQWSNYLDKYTVQVTLHQFYCLLDML